MLEIVLSNRFKKDLKLAARRGYNLDLLDQIVETLASFPVSHRNSFRFIFLTKNERFALNVIQL